VYSTKPATLQELQQEIERCGQPSLQQIWWPLVNHLLTDVNCVTKLTVVILNTYAKFAISLNANADVFNGLGY
jgi:hypothetical protein